MQKNNMITPKISVVGSSNFDLIAYTKRLPHRGETILGTDFKMGCGGKGANQAVAAAKLGAHVTMITKLGNDIFGKQTLENYKFFNINTQHVSVTDRAPSGVAPIWVDENGFNSIIVVPGSNNLMTLQELALASKEIESSALLLCQNEIPFEITYEAVKIANSKGVKTVFNPAPAPSFTLKRDFLNLIDMICLNETEAELLTGIFVKNLSDAKKAAHLFLENGVKKVVFTLGEKGCVYINSQTSHHLEAAPVAAIDTTGAGDCFIGSFSFFYGLGFDMVESLRKAQIVASYSVQKHGTQTSFPHKTELPSEIFTY